MCISWKPKFCHIFVFLYLWFVCASLVDVSQSSMGLNTKVLRSGNIKQKVIWLWTKLSQFELTWSMHAFVLNNLIGGRYNNIGTFVLNPKHFGTQNMGLEARIPRDSRARRDWDKPTRRDRIWRLITSKNGKTLLISRISSLVFILYPWLVNLCVSASCGPQRQILS